MMRKRPLVGAGLPTLAELMAEAWKRSSMLEETLRRLTFNRREGHGLLRSSAASEGELMLTPKWRRRTANA